MTDISDISCSQQASEILLLLPTKWSELVNVPGNPLVIIFAIFWARSEKVVVTGRNL